MAFQTEPEYIVYRIILRLMGTLNFDKFPKFKTYSWSVRSLKGSFAIFYMLAKYVPGDIKYIFTKFYRHISTNNESNRKFVILISNLFMGCDILAR